MIKITISIVPLIVIISLDLEFIFLIFFENHPHNTHENFKWSTLEILDQSRIEFSNWIYIYTHTRSSPGGYEEVRATKHQFVSTGSIRFHPLERALRDSPTIAPTCIEWRKDVLVGQKDWHRGIKLLCVTAKREYSIIIDVFSPSPLWIHRFYCETILAQLSTTSFQLSAIFELGLQKKKKSIVVEEGI